MNWYLTIIENKIAIEIPVSIANRMYDAESYIANNYLQFSFVDEHGRRILKEGIGYHDNQEDLIKWGYNIIPLI